MASRSSVPKAALAAVLLLATGGPLSTAGGSDRVAPDLPEFLDGKPVAQAIVQFDSPAAAVQAAPFIAARGVRILDRMHVLPAALVEGPSAALLSLGNVPGIAYVEPNRLVHYDNGNDTISSRAKPVWDDPTAVGLGLPPIRDDDGNVIDGRGVTVAVVDSGINAEHPDLAYRSKVLMNLYPVGIPHSQLLSGVSMQDVASTYFLHNPHDPEGGDPRTGIVIRYEDRRNTEGGGHGTHMAGIVAGTGAASGGEYRGVAPGASILGFGDGGGEVWYSVRAWEWIYENGSSLHPPVRVVTNSWNVGYGPCHEEYTLTKLQRMLVQDRGLVVTMSVGNGDAGGASDEVSEMAHCGPGGAFGVTASDDGGLGARDLPFPHTGRRGLATDPSSWPALAAPGVDVLAPDSNARPWGYARSTGTSPATAHVAGAVALLFQANPALTPPQVQCLLETTAYKFDANGREGPYVSGFHDWRYDGSNYARGHGLLDGYAAVRAALDLKHGSLTGAAGTCSGV